MLLAFHARHPLTCLGRLIQAVCVASTLGTTSLHAEPDADAAPAQRWQLHAQSTWIWQHKPAFHAAYSGEHSLSPRHENDHSFSTTLFAGLRLAPDTEVYLNPEMVAGSPMSNLTGLGGLTNGELQKTSGPHLKLYRARAFLRQTWALGDEREAVASDANQLGGNRPVDRVVLTVGNLAVSDLFDVNAVAHDARTQFLNWALISNGAYDFAADARGYSLGAAAEYVRGPWALRAGRFALPQTPNASRLDRHLDRHHGDQIELERATGLMTGLDGRVRLLWFRNTMRTGRFDEALALADADGGTPDTAAVRRRQAKQGWGLGMDQALSDELSVFARTARSDGRTEVEAFAEIDRSLSMGAVLRGQRWGQAGDAVGLAWARNALSSSHRRYLTAGGSGFFVGDGALNYRAETITELYYSLALPDLQPLRHSALTLDVQHVANPAYNRDRGPVRMLAVRLHSEI